MRSTAPWGPPALFVMGMAVHKERAPGDGGVCTEQEGVQSGANPSSAACALAGAGQVGTRPHPPLLEGVPPALKKLSGRGAMPRRRRRGGQGTGEGVIPAYLATVTATATMTLIILITTIY